MAYVHNPAGSVQACMCTYKCLIVCMHLACLIPSRNGKLSWAHHPFFSDTITMGPFFFVACAAAHAQGWDDDGTVKSYAGR